MEEALQAGAIGSVGGLRGLPQEGAHAAQPPGSEAGYRDSVLNLRLGNRGNACYCNAMLQCLLYASSWKGGPEWMFAGSMLQYVRSILRREDIFHVWTHPLWVMTMRGWRLPSRQHDIVEFFQYFLGCQPHTEHRLRLVWQARAQQEDGGIGGDGGTSSPLLLQPPERAAMVDDYADYATSVQRLIEEWHEQDAMHAALCLPQILTFQAGRFDYSPESGEARKRRYSISPDAYVEMPYFVDDRWTVAKAWYQLCAISIHIGDSPKSGHYLAILYDTPIGVCYLADDWQRTVRLSAEASAGYRTDSYLFYARCD